MAATRTTLVAPASALASIPPELTVRPAHGVQPPDDKGNTRCRM